MRSLTALLVLLFLVLDPTAHAAQRNLAVTKSVGEQKRVALVIGNAAYQGASPLRNPVNDAHAMADALNKLGFHVIEVTDASQKEMNRAIAEFGGKLNAETAALFFYAGHGLQVRNKNYLVPVDAQINGEAAVRAETVDVDTVLDQLNVSSLSIVILDACRNNPFERSFRKMGGGLAQMDAPKGSFIAYATAPGKTAADGDGKNGLFTQELLKQINTPGLSLESVFKRVRANVSATTGDAQMPWDSSSMTGNFYFKPGDGTQIASLVPVVPAQPARIKSKEEIEQEAWEGTRDSRSEAGVQEYLKQYPKGRYVAQARILIATLKAEAAKPVPTPTTASVPLNTSHDETELWAEAQKGNSKEDYQAYLDQYPKGKFATLANARIKKLQDDALAAAEQKEQQVWDAAQQENSEAGYTRYLKGYPSGRYAGHAKESQDKIAIAAREKEEKAKEEAELWKKAEADEKGQAVQAYLDQYPSGSHVAAAQEKLATIKKAEEMRPGKVFRDCPDCPEMVILTKLFAMGKYEVTQKEWRAVMGGNPPELYFKNCGDTCPVEQVSWNDAQEFIQKLNSKTGKQYRLPTEAEWEYACYGGSQSMYCGRGNLDAVGWYSNNSGDKTHPAGQKQANGYGLYDMSGNVREWMSDCYDGDCAKHVFRGGSWIDDPSSARAASRYGARAAFRGGSLIGFRLAKTLP